MMNASFSELYDELTANDRERFVITTRRLMKNTFIVKDKDERGKADYAFIMKYADLYEEYLRYLGYSLRYDREEGIIMLCSEVHVAVNRVSFNKVETIIYLVLFSLYYENRRENYGYTRYVDVSIIDVIHALDKYEVRKIVEKQLYNTLDKFDQRSLIRKNEDYTEESGSIRLYASLAMGIDLDVAKAQVDIRRKQYHMDTETKNGFYNEDEEDTDLEEESEDIIINEEDSI